jgi:phosphatidate phosphatase APP1
METTFAGPEGWLVVSDIDDTIKYTQTSDTTGIIRTTFAEEPKPIPGMPQLYSRIEKRFEPTWFYLSASPHNLYPFLRGFLREHFSPGTLILRDFSWLDISELVKSFTVDTMEYKVDRIRKIRRWFPHRRAICIGDSTQTDPEAYAEIYRRHSEWIHAILIRKVMDVPHMEEQNSLKRFAEAFQDVPKHIWRVFEHPRDVYDVLDQIRARDNASFFP